MQAGSLISVVRAVSTNGGKSIILGVPKAVRELLSIEKGARFAVSVVGDKRIVYDLLEEEAQ